MRAGRSHYFPPFVLGRRSDGGPRDRGQKCGLMKNTLPALILSLACLTAAPALADITLVQDTLLNGVSSRSTMWIKGEKTRSDNDTTSSVIMDAATGDMITLVHEQKMIIKTNTKELATLAAQAGASAAAQDLSTTKITATGQREKVDGYDCEIYLSENQGMAVKMWVTQDYPNQEKLRNEMKVLSKLAAPGAPKQPEVPGIAVKTEFVQQGLKFTTKLISLSADPVDEARFVVPADYKAP